MASRYLDIKTARASVTGSQYYINNVYPDIPPTDADYYVITTIGDRLDLFANDFYNDSSLWWIIATANALPGDSVYPPIGMQLRIPANVPTILATYTNVNNGI